MAENAGGDLNSNLLHAPYRTGDPQLDTAIGQWLRWDKVGTWAAGILPCFPHALPHTVCCCLSPPGARQLQRRWLRPPGGSRGAGRCHPLMPGPAPRDRPSWAGTPVVASFYSERNRNLPFFLPPPSFKCRSSLSLNNNNYY